MLEHSVRHSRVKATMVGLVPLSICRSISVTNLQSTFVPMERMANPSQGLRSDSFPHPKEVESEIIGVDR